LESRISIVKFFPIIKDETFETYFRPGIKGKIKLTLAVIVETYGSGNLPKNRPKIIEILKAAVNRNQIIVNVSQCRKGLTAINYECGDLIQDLGIIYGGDMTVECAMAKLSYLLGKGYDVATIKKLFRENLKGELSIIQEDIFCLHSNNLIGAILKMINNETKTEESHIMADSLLPTIINELVEKDNIEMLKKLENSIKLIHFRDYTKRNPLHIAALNGNYEMAKFLIKLRVNINEIDDNKNTPLNYACLGRHREVALLLKENGGILNQNKDMGSYFCKLAYDDDLDTIKLFYECGANLTVCDYDKRTLVHVAALEGKDQIIEYIVKNTNINIMVVDRWGKTPYSYANEISKAIIESKYRVGVMSKKKQKKLNIN
jgi:lysophospholipase